MEEVGVDEEEAPILLREIEDEFEGASAGVPGLGVSPAKLDSLRAAREAESLEGQDHSGHDHSGHDHSGHDHSGHDHSGHDH